MLNIINDSLKRFKEITTNDESISSSVSDLVADLNNINILLAHS
ncbi:DUF4280 domain-containing protein, partial [Francisella tularensis subsp. holarctica]|nr:DUF4280 domain-containing protein [Francisella tularensis subsp. holarctica]